MNQLIPDHLWAQVPLYHDTVERLWLDFTPPLNEARPILTYVYKRTDVLLLPESEGDLVALVRIRRGPFRWTGKTVLRWNGRILKPHRDCIHTRKVGSKGWLEIGCAELPEALL